MKRFFLTFFILINVITISLGQFGKLSKIINTVRDVANGVNKAKVTTQTIQPNKDISSNTPLDTRNVSSQSTIPVDSKKLPIHEFAQTGNIQGLTESLENGMYVDIAIQRNIEYFQSLNHLTPLMLAVQNHQLASCKLLLLYGADPSLKNAENNSALDIAQKSNYQDIVKVLINNEVSIPNITISQALLKAQKAYSVGEYIVANNFGNIAYRTMISNKVSKNLSDYKAVLSLLADSYEKMAIFSKAEWFHNQLIDINEKAKPQNQTSYYYSVLKLCNYYTRIAQFEKASLLLDILYNWSNKNTSMDNMVQAKIIDAKVSLLIAERSSQKKSWIVKALDAKKKLVGEKHYEYAISLLKAFQIRTLNTGLVEKEKSNNFQNLLGSAMSEGIQKQLEGVTNQGYDMAKKQMAASGHDTTKMLSKDALQNIMSANKNQVNKDIDKAGNTIGKLVYKSMVLNSSEEITYTIDIIENLVEQIKNEEGEFGENYLMALQFQAYVYHENHQLALEDTTTQRIQTLKEKITKVNFKRGLAYYPDANLLEHNYLLLLQANEKQSLDHWFKQKSIIEKTYGKVHPSYINVLNAIAQTYEGNSQISNFYKEQADMLISYLGTHYAVPTISEKTYSILMPDLESHRNQLKYFMIYWSKKNDLATNYLYNFVLNDKQKLLIKFQKFKQNQYVSANATTTEISKDLKKASAITGKDITYEKAYGFNQKQHTELILNTSAFARNIATQANDYFNFGVPGEFENGEEVNPAGTRSMWQNVQSKLKKGQAVIEYFYVDKSKIYPDSTNVEYYALVLKPNSSKVILKYLFLSKELNLPQQYSNQSIDSRNTNRGPIFKKKNIQDNLYELCWKPIESVLDATDVHIYYSPSGLLQTISFVAINTPQGKILGEKYQLTCLSSSEKILQEPPKIDINTNTSIELFGNPTTTQDNLPNALLEVRNIQNILLKKTKKIKIYEGEKATETIFKAIGNRDLSPTIVHLAAHGLYDKNVGNQQVNNALLQSFILLANGDTQKPVDLNRSDDGILTAYEVSMLNFTNTKLVVLSTCESGLGKDGGDEGIAGLQRAFRMAGAEYIIASLQTVPDDFTSEMMCHFYTQLANGKDTAEAFLNAQKTMREMKYSTDKWASFVLIR